MSTGETQPSAIARFTSPSSTMSNNNKKYPGTPKSPMANTNTIGNRNSQTRQRLLSSKISAPRPMNLPSLRREHAVGTEVPASSPATSHGWGSSTTSSPSTPFIQPTEIIKPTEQTVVTSPVMKPAESAIDSTSKVDPASSPTLNNSQSSTVRAWAVPTVSEPTVQPPSTDFPTAAEAAKKNPLLYDDKEYLKYASSDPNHTSWDEMVSEDLDDFQVDVVEFDDGTKVQVDGAEEAINPVSPSDRFTEDYDRSYPPRHNNESTDHGHNKPSYRRSEDHGYTSRYNNSVHGIYDNRRHSTATSNDERRPSTTAPTTNDRWSRRESVDNNMNNNTNAWTNIGNRRSSYDRKSSGPPPVHNIAASIPSIYHPTLLQRPRRLSEQSVRSDHSREEQLNPLQAISEPASNEQLHEVDAEICAVQREVMLSAAERAKKRRDEEEAEREAARTRAKHKAELMAEEARLNAEEKESKKDAVKKESPVKKEASVKKEVSIKKEVSVKKEAPIITIEKKPAVMDIEKRPNTPSKSKSAPSAEKKNDPKKESIPLLPVKIQKVNEPASLPDTSKPWNLVAANKEVVIEKRPTTMKLPSNERIESSNSKKDSKAEAKKEIVVPTIDKSENPLSNDEQNREFYVATIKTDATAPIPKEELSYNDWNSYATRLQESDIEMQATSDAKNKANNSEKIVEIVDYTQNEDWGTIPSHITQGRGYDRGWTRNDEEHGGYNRNSRGGRGRGVSDRGSRGGRGRGAMAGRGSISNGISSSQRQQFDVTNSNDPWRQATNDTANGDEHKHPVVTEILKHESGAVVRSKTTKQHKQEEHKATKKQREEVHATAISKKTSLSSLWKGSSSPIFPNVIEKVARKKPVNMNFLMDKNESDRDITMMDQPVINHTQYEVSDKQQVEIVEQKTVEKVDAESASAMVSDIEKDNVNVPMVATTSDTEKDNVNVAEAVDETSTISSTTSTPPRAQFQRNGHLKPDSTSPRRMNVNSNYPVLVYQYPLSQQQQQHSEDVRSKGIQQRPMGVYLMPHQQYVTGNQYMVPYPQAGTGVQSVYYPALPWQQQQQSQTSYNNGSGSSPRPHYEQRRQYNNNYKSTDDNLNNSSEWEATSHSNGYQSHRYNNSTISYQRGNSYRKRGVWANTANPRGRGSYAYQPRRYPDANSIVHTQPSAPENL